MVALHKLEQWENQIAQEFGGSRGLPGRMDTPVPGHDRFETGTRILDAVGLDLSLDSGILDVEDLVN